MADSEKTDVAAREESILAFWKEKGIFEKTLNKPAPNGEFVFYDGPPFATGLPHQGSLLSSVSKDLIPRYKTMRGYRVRRRWGWDTHGLPIESLVEKKLGLKNKKEILQIGIETFNETARSMVLEYVHEWKRYVERVGRFVDFDNSYKTMDNTFIESVWWGLKQIHSKGRLYEGRKVLMYCPHCETPLAKAEIAMDNTYKDITEEAVTVKFKVKSPVSNELPENTFILAWTTTPWTLPANSALAVGPALAYGLYEKDGEALVVAVPRAEALGLTAPSRTMKGTELVGIEYEPLYSVPKIEGHAGEKYKVFAEEYVSAEDGTGIVHTGTIYGEEDYALILKEKLPALQLLNANATYNTDAPEFLHGEYIRKANPKIIEDLRGRGLLFKSEQHTHSYPHCYRCGTALIYNAVSSWFINIQAVKERMLSENEKITWVPGHLKKGRFHHNLETAPDWTISRNRFWASPLPIWKDAKGNVTVIGSLTELKERTKKSGNRYFVMRHGEAENNVRNINSTRLENAKMHHLTDAGRIKVEEVSAAAAGEGFDLILSSPFARTFETAEIVARACGMAPSDILVEERLREIATGVFEGKTIDEYHHFFSTVSERFDRAPEGGETFSEVRQRVGELLYELEEKYAGKRILLVSHGDPLWLLRLVSNGGTRADVEGTAYPVRGEIEELLFVPVPHTKDYELDFHLPYIDRIQLQDEEGNLLTRIPEVVDCWVESGSMPFAEYHYPFENTSVFEKRSPGDFISEYIGQTRAWFYYMHAMSVELFGHRAFRNVITTGNVLAADGAKLSKSKNNYTDPYVLFDRYGADAFRYSLMSSVVMQAEDLTFRDDDVKDAHARVVNMLRNVHSFLSLHKEELTEQKIRSTHPLDEWILVRLEQVLVGTTAAFDAYDVPRGVRFFREFIEDLSTWYLRRSRDRIKGTDLVDRQRALHTLRDVLVTFSQIIAPVMPFVAEEIYRDLRTSKDPESVHLSDWPRVPRGGMRMLPGFRAREAKRMRAMERVRTLVSEALRLRQTASIKVRQPLQQLSIPGTLPAHLLRLLAEEVNVKEIRTQAAAVELDTVLSPDLIREGDVRGFARAVAEARKEEGFSAKDMVVLHITENSKNVLEGAYVPGVGRLVFDANENAPHCAELSFGNVRFSLARDAA